jgi:hypothetical protein
VKSVPSVVIKKGVEKMNRGGLTADYSDDTDGKEVESAKSVPSMVIKKAWRNEPSEDSTKVPGD